MADPKTQGVDTMTRTQTAMVGGNLVAGGGSIILLVTALQMLGQHGGELNEMRNEQRSLRSEISHLSSEADARLIKVETDTRGMVADVSVLRQWMRDPHSIPGAWSRSDDRQRMDEYDRTVRDWIDKRLLEERGRVLAGGTIGIMDLIEIQRAIVSLPTGDGKSWTQDGKPKVESIEELLQRQVSASERDRAWSMLQTARTLRND